MSFTSVIPPRVGDLEKAIADLVDVAGTQAFTGGAGRVGWGAEPSLPALSKAMPARLLVRRRGGSGKSEHLDRVTSVEIMVRADVKSGLGGDAGHFLSGIHAAVFNALEGKTPTMAGASVLHPVRRIEPESMVLSHDKEGFLYSRTLFKVILNEQ